MPIGRMNNASVRKPEMKEDSDQELSQAMAEIMNAVKAVRFGQITIVVQDGKVVQIDKTEKYRLR